MKTEGDSVTPETNSFGPTSNGLKYLQVRLVILACSRTFRICARAFCHTAVSTVFPRSLPTKNRFRSLGAHHGFFLVKGKCGTRTKFSMPKRALVGCNSEIGILEIRRLPYDLMVVKSTSVFGGMFCAHFKSCSLDRRANIGSLMWTNATNGAAQYVT